MRKLYPKITTCKYILNNINQLICLTCLAGDSYTITTPGLHRYDLVWLVPHKELNVFSFDVIACSEAMVVLAQVPGIYNRSAYMFAIGGRQNSETLLARAVNGGWQTVAAQSTREWVLFNQ